MPIDYEMAKREMPKLKTALTRAKKSKDNDKVIAACDAAFARFEAWGAYPDAWHAWHTTRTACGAASHRISYPVAYCFY